MRRKIIEALCREASAEEAERARAVLRSDGNIIADLLDAGLHRRLVMGACTAATGIPKAPSAWFKEGPVLDFGELDVSLCETHCLVPIAREDGELCLAFGDPLIAANRDALPLPPHRAYLATPTKVGRAVKRLLTRLPLEQTLTRSRPPATGESSALSNKSRKKKRNERRAASSEGYSHSAPHAPDRKADPAPAPAARAAAPPPPRSTHAEEQAPPSPPPPVLRDTRRLDDPARSHGPLDPPLPPSTGLRGGSALDPALPPARAQPAPPRPPKPRPQAKPAAAPAASASAGWLLKLLVVAAIGAVVFVVARGNIEKPRARDDREEPPPVVAQGKVVLGARQRSLIDRAAAATSSVDALNSLTDAVNLDPSSIEGRDALLARARLYLVGGEAERARRDLLRLQQRKDVEPLRGEVDALLADIVKRFGNGTDVAPKNDQARAPAADAGALVAPDAGAPR